MVKISRQVKQGVDTVRRVRMIRQRPEITQDVHQIDVFGVSQVFRACQQAVAQLSERQIGKLVMCHLMSLMQPPTATTRCARRSHRIPPSIAIRFRE
jgi:hypothetical protein